MKLLGKLPIDCYVAVSGGPDSIAAARFLSKRNPTILHVNHNTEFGNQAEIFVREQFENVIVHKIDSTKPKNKSWEEFWRDERYKFFSQFNKPIILGHNLNDVAETYLFSAIHGIPKIIPYQNGNCIRPFLLTSKQELESYCQRHNHKYLIDPSNLTDEHARGTIRNELMPLIESKLNKGFLKVIKRKVEKEYGRIETSD